MGATPELHIGAQSGEQAYESFRIVDAKRLSDGRIVILDAGSKDARLLGVDGQHLRTIATAGPGPGELQSPRSVSITTGDSLTIIDRGAMIRFSSVRYTGCYPGLRRVSSPSCWTGLAVAANDTGDPETPDGDVETGGVGINSDYCMTCSGQRSGAAAHPAAAGEKMNMDH